MKTESEISRNSSMNGSYEPLPDFYLTGEDFKLAVELELSLKSQIVIFLKWVNTEGPVLLMFSMWQLISKKMQSLIKTFRYRKSTLLSLIISTWRK